MVGWIQEIIVRRLWVCEVVLSLLSFAAASAAEPVDWPVFGGNAERTGNIDGKAGPEKPNERWRFVDPDSQAMSIDASPAVCGGRVYIGGGKSSPFGNTGKMYCLDLKGNLIWEFKTAKWVFSSPAVCDGRVYFGEGLHTDAPCKLYCLSAETGKELWTFTSRSHVESSPQVLDGKIYFGAGDDGVFCLDAKTGKQIWNFPNAHVDLAPAIVDGKLYAGTGYGKLGAFCLDAASGKLLWFSPTTVSVWGSPVVHGTSVYFGVGNGNFRESAPEHVGGVISFDILTGKRNWTLKLPDAVMTSIVLGKERLYCGCRDGNVYAIGLAKGEIVWKFATGGPVLATPALIENQMFVLGGDPSVRMLDAGTGKEIWRYDLVKMTGSSQGDLDSSPAISGGCVIFGTGKGNVISLGK
jgi:outer membrane protein assembly factor BamB